MNRCAVPDCARSDIKGRGLCPSHYSWAKYRGIIESFAPRKRPLEGRLCDVSGCEKGAHHGAFCSMHTERKRRTGDVGAAAPKKPHRSKSPVCAVEGCERKTYGFGFCTMHYARFKQHGDPGPAGLTRRANGEGSIELGYRSFAVNGKREREHRMVWVEAHGPIPDGYVIHHKNGDKLDNRLENLEMMTRGAHRRHHHDDIQAGKTKGY